MAAKEAEANGMGEDDDIRAEVNEVIGNITAGAKEQGYTLKSYLKLAYGSTMTVSTFKKMMTLEEVATHYMQHYQEELSYTESQLEEYYQANSSDFDVASYEYIYFKGTADSTTDADGNTVQPHRGRLRGCQDRRCRGCRRCAGALSGRRVPVRHRRRL